MSTKISNQRLIYLDNAASTPIADEVLAAMQPYLTTHYGNPGMAYQLGTKSKVAIEQARRSISEVLHGADPRKSA